MLRMKGTILGGIVLLFQALLLAHGGLTTLGANTVSMGIVGPLAISEGILTVLIFRALRQTAPAELETFGWRVAASFGRGSQPKSLRRTIRT